MYSDYSPLRYIAGGALAIVIFLIAAGFVLIIALWKIFEKAGEKGWKSLIPFYSSYIEFKLAWSVNYFWFYLAALILTYLTGAFPILCAVFGITSTVFGIILMAKLAKSFGKDGGFAVGLVLLSPVFLMILGFGSARYSGPVIDSENNQQYKKVYIECIKGSRKGEKFPVNSGVYIGRDPARCGIVLNAVDNKVSRVHCFVNLCGNNVYVTDQNSTGGTYIDGMKLTPGIPTEFGSGSVMYLASADVAFRVLQFVKKRIVLEYLLLISASKEL